MEASTITRLTAMQIWPWCKNAPVAASRAALSRSASASTMSGAFPPSSKDTFFIGPPLIASSPTRRPTGVDPVKEMSLGTGCVTKSSPISEPAPVTLPITPAGTPASSKMRAGMRPPVTGVSLAALITTALPSASAGATERMDRCNGKFQGLMIPTTPLATR